MCFIIEPSAVAYSQTVYATGHPIVPPLVTMRPKRLQNRKAVSIPIVAYSKSAFLLSRVPTKYSLQPRIVCSQNKKSFK